MGIFTLILCYFPPECAITDILLELCPVIQMHVNSTQSIVVAGDFNCRLDTENGRGEDLCQNLETLGLTCVNDHTSPTYICHNGSSVIDLFFILDRRNCNFSHVNILPSELTKHQFVTYNIDMDSNILDKKKDKVKSIDTDILAEKMTFIDNISAENYDFFIESVRKSAAKRPKKRKSKPWFDRECYNLLKASKHLRKRLVSDRSCLEIYAESKKLFKKQCQKKRKKYLSEKENHMLQKAEADRSDFWSILKCRTPVRTPSAVQHSVWTDHFASLYGGNSDVKLPDFEQNTSDYSDELDRPISLPEITKSVARQPNGKAVGPDSVSNEAWKQSFGAVFTLILTLFNCCFTSKSIPASWREAYVIPLYKGKGQKADPDNYRGIALLNCIYKCYTTIIYDRLYNWCSQHFVIPDTQFGFQKGKSTTDAVTLLKQDIESNIQEHGHLYACFVDFRKAFDTVNRTLLLRKLYKIGISGNFIRVLHSLLKFNTLRVNTEGYLTSDVIQRVGLAQGDKLSPLLFIIFIADLSDLLTQHGCKCIFYADDLVITSHNRFNVQVALCQLNEYCQENGLSVNISKTKAVKFRRGGALKSTDFLRYRGKMVEFVNSFEYLGVVFTSFMKPTAHIQKNKKNGIKQTNILAAKLDIQKIHFCSAERLFHSVVLPSATYGFQTLNIDPICLTPVAGYFWKRWAGLSKYASTSRLLGNIYENDFLDIRNQKGEKRRAIANYYSHGLHQKICKFDKCYTPTEFCECKLCDDSASSFDHILDDAHTSTTQDRSRDLRPFYT